MTIIGWLILAEIITAIALVAWLLHRTHKRLKHSPAEQALIQHLAELEHAKSGVKKGKNSKKASESNDTNMVRSNNNKLDVNDNSDASDGTSA